MLCKSHYKALKSSKVLFLVNRSFCLTGGLKPSSWPIGVSEWDARLVFGPPIGQWEGPIGQLEAPVQWTGDIGEPEGPERLRNLCLKDANYLY
jgi:hypothetical protein